MTILLGIVAAMGLWVAGTWAWRWCWFYATQNLHLNAADMAAAFDAIYRHHAASSERTT